MKKVLIALDNLKVFTNINKDKLYDMYNQDIIFKEGVLEYISKNPVDVIVTRDDLEGDMIKEIYIKQIRMLVPSAKIVLFVKYTDNNYLEFLYNNRVFDILDSKEDVNISNIIDMIESKKIQGYSNESNTGNSENAKINVITKKKIAVFGTSGSGKSYVASIVANMISKKLNMKTLLMDFDLQSSAIDIYNNLNCNNNILMDIVKCVDNQTLNSEKFDNIVYKRDNMGYITNNSSLYECQNNISARHCEKIFEVASQNYDVIVSDITANIYFDTTYSNIKNSDIIMFVISPNYISIRQAIKYLDLITNVWGIDRNHIYLVINKITDSSLSTSQIESLIAGYKTIMQLNYDNDIENVINGISNINQNAIKEDKEIYRIFGVEGVTRNQENSRKSSFLYSLFRKEEKQ